MEEIDINRSLQQENLFDLFVQQLRKDFESAGAGQAFSEELPADFEALKQRIVAALNVLLKNNLTLLSSLLYRVDISEHQLTTYQRQHTTLLFEEVVAELIIKRVLQKVILRKTFSG